MREVEARLGHRLKASDDRVGEQWAGCCPGGELKHSTAVGRLGGQQT